MPEGAVSNGAAVTVGLTPDVGRSPVTVALAVVMARVCFPYHQHCSCQHQQAPRQFGHGSERWREDFSVPDVGGGTEKASGDMEVEESRGEARNSDGNSCIRMCVLMVIMAMLVVDDRDGIFMVLKVPMMVIIV